MIVQILVDNPNSWIVPYAEKLVVLLKEAGHKSTLLHKHSEVANGDILCLLGCEKIFNDLHKNKHNLVVHESMLPQGKGWSPLTWQIIEGKNEIPVTLFEAAEKVDAGVVYLVDKIDLNGTELLPEIKHKQGVITQKMILEFIQRYESIVPREQNGEESFYKKRTPKHSELNINLSIKEQFNLFRVCDNERYPAWFEINGKRYLLRIYNDK